MFDFDNQTIHLMKHTTLLMIAFLFSSLTISQTTIQGNVTDGISPLEWTNIYIKNSIIGTTSDKNGDFTIKAKKGDTLVFSYTGYQAKEIVITNQKFIPITLDNESLDEVFIVVEELKRCKTARHSCSSRYSISCNTEGNEVETTLDHVISKKTNPSLFPNPSSDGIFNLKMTDTHKEVQVYVTNMLGQRIQSSIYQNSTTAIRLDLSSLRTGVYLINTIADGQPLPTQKAIRR